MSTPEVRTLWARRALIRRAFFMTGIGLPACMAAALVAEVWRLRGPDTLVWSVLVLAPVVLGLFLASFRVQHRLVRTLREGDYRYCPGCCYDLRGVADPGVCPECGRPYSRADLAEDWARKIGPLWHGELVRR